MTQVRTHRSIVPATPVVVPVPPAPSATPSPPPPKAPLTSAALSAAARRLFTRGPLLLRTLQHLRPYICPFEEVIRHIPPGSTVLDVGCGGGLFLGLLNESGILNTNAPGGGAGGVGGVGFDCSRPAIRIAQSMAVNAKGGARLDFLALDVSEPWPSTPGGFDAVSIIDVMHHVPLAARRSLIEQAVARLRPGGLLIYKDMTARSWRSIANRLHDLVLARQFIRYTPVETVESWGRDLGLKLMHSQRLNRLCYGHELLVFEAPLPGGSSAR